MHPLLKQLPPLLLGLGSVLMPNQSSLAQSPIELPDLGDPSGSVITPHEESKLGRAFYESLLERKLIFHDALLSEYIESLGARITSNANTGNQLFTFFVVKDDAINAFAAPGGFIGIYTGLIEFAENEDELAAVIAHETAHITQRHMARTYEQTERYSLPYAVAILSAILLSRNNKQGMEAALATGFAATAQHSINFTRANEKEADRVGIQIMSQAGFDPTAMGEFFARLQHEARFYGEQAPEFLRTHPVNSNRIADALGRAEVLGKISNPDPTVFRLMRMRAKVLLLERPEKQIETIEERNKEKDKPEAADLYGLALLYNQADQQHKSIKLLQGLIEQDEARVPYFHALAEAYSGLEQYKTAVATLNKGLQLYPDDHALSLSLGEALLQTGDSATAQSLLREHLNDGYTDIPTFKLLSRAAEANNDLTTAHESLAESYYLQGDLASAIQQLRLAQKSAIDDYHERSRISARLRDWETTKRDRDKDK